MTRSTASSASSRVPRLEPAGVFRHGRLANDVEAWQARWADTEVVLTATEFGILPTLAVMPSKVFSRDAVIARLHGPGFTVTDRTKDSHIRNLRAKFAAVGAEDLIESRAGIGYSMGTCGGKA